MALNGVTPIKDKTGKSIIATWRKPSKKSELGAEGTAKAKRKQTEVKEHG
jgi:hypothetical protein